MISTPAFVWDSRAVPQVGYHLKDPFVIVVFYAFLGLHGRLHAYVAQRRRVRRTPHQRLADFSC